MGLGVGINVVGDAVGCVVGSDEDLKDNRATQNSMPRLLLCNEVEFCIKLTLIGLRVGDTVRGVPDGRFVGFMIGGSVIG